MMVIPQSIAPHHRKKAAVCGSKLSVFVFGIVFFVSVFVLPHHLFAQNILGTLTFEEDSIAVPQVNREADRAVMVVSSNLAQIGFESTNPNFEVQNKGNGQFLVILRPEERYLIWVKAKGYQNSGRISVFMRGKESKSYKVTAELVQVQQIEEGFGGLEIEATVPKTQIKIEGLPGTITLPYKEENIKTGAYRLIYNSTSVYVKADTQDVFVKKDEVTKVSFDTRPQIVPIMFISERPDFEITHDGEVVVRKVGGKFVESSKKYEFVGGANVLRFPAFLPFSYKATAEGYYDVVDTLTNLVNGTPKEVLLDFERHKGSLQLSSSDSAFVYINGKLVDENPIIQFSEDREIGPYTVTFTPIDSRLSYSREVSVRKDQVTRIVLDFKNPGSLTTITKKRRKWPFVVLLTLSGSAYYAFSEGYFSPDIPGFPAPPSPPGALR